MTRFDDGFRERNEVREVRLAQYTTIRIGGSATLVTLHDRADLAALCDGPLRWLGKGANLLVDDGGVTEPVARLGEAFKYFAVDDAGGERVRVRAGASCDLAKLVQGCAGAGLAGPEGLAGVPATVGGALRMNAGTAQCWILDWVSRVEALLPGEAAPRWIERAELPARYRHGGLPAGAVALGCEMELPRGDSERLKVRARELKQAKAASQPLGARSAGCIFKNPSPELPAGRLIDELGLKGERQGDAQISTRHGNFIVNEGDASAADVYELIRRARRRAWEQRGVVLELEVETWNAPDDLRAHPSGETAA